MLCKDNKFRIFEILNNIKQNDPGLMKLISDYRDDFKNNLDSPITEEDKQIETQADKIQQEKKEKKEKAKKDKEEINPLIIGQFNDIINLKINVNYKDKIKDIKEELLNNIFKIKIRKNEK